MEKLSGPGITRNYDPVNGAGQRKTARAAGLKKFWTGKPCARGHLSTRFTSTGHCAACLRENARRNRSAPAGTARFVVLVPPERMADLSCLVQLFGGLEVLAPVPRDVVIPLDMADNFRAALGGIGAEVRP